jgi:membrane-associated phospholipid phosphatase
MLVAVIALRWHYPTDALAGVVLGVGVVLIVDRAAQSLPGLQSSGQAVGGRNRTGQASNVRRALFSRTRRRSTQAFAGLELEAATEAAPRIGRG